MQVAWRRIIAEINKAADYYLLAASGGVDSMFMLAFFLRNCRKPFRVAHFNHRLRTSADDAEELVRTWCRKNGVPFVVGAGDPDLMRSAESLEAEARRQRFGFLSAVAENGEMIVTAHHANDQLETVILRLMRGYPDSNLRMKRISGSRYKPFLEVPKEEILHQALTRRLQWIEDETNTDLAYERNWVRHVLVPQMMERRNILKSMVLNERTKSETENEGEPLFSPLGPD